ASFSMGVKVGDKTCFDLARGKAEAIVDPDGPAGGHGFSVLLMTDMPHCRIVPEPSEKRDEVVRIIKKERLPHGSAHLGKTLRAVEDMLALSVDNHKEYQEREVYFLTDLQRSNWIPNSTNAVEQILKRIQSKARVMLVDVGQQVDSNLAVTDLT